MRYSFENTLWLFGVLRRLLLARSSRIKASFFLFSVFAIVLIVMNSLGFPTQEFLDLLRFEPEEPSALLEVPPVLFNEPFKVDVQLLD